jgi:DNA-binding winged helix-turn-helix (wHTH) protein
LVRNGTCHFLGFTFDWHDDQLRRQGSPLKLRAKTLAVLRLFLQRPGVVLSKEDLLSLVWPGVAVTEVVLNVCIAELRRAFGDVAANPRFIETLHRRGFRFIAPITTDEPIGADQANTVEVSDAGIFVGRRAELKILIESWHRARQGPMQIVIVAGDPGIGKTALVDRFLTEIAKDAGDGLVVGRGQCLDLNATAEPFMPILEALRSITGTGAAARLAELIRIHAPSWQPLLFSDAARPEAPRGEPGHESMVRELIVVLQAITKETPLVLALEDLHWSDPSTIDFVSTLAQQRAPSRLLLVGTLRPADAILQGRPRRLLRLVSGARNRVREMQLELLGEAAVREYLECRLGDTQTAAVLAPHVAARTDGSPLFMVAVVDHLIDSGVLEQHGDRWRLTRQPEEIAEQIPPSITRLLREQISAFSAAERAALDVACIAGSSFAAQAIAAGMDCDLEEAEGLCADLAERRRFLVDTGPAAWPDGSIGEGYRFRHMIYRQVVDGSLTGGRRQALHRRIGARLESGFADRVGEVAGELAAHFRNAGDHEKVFKYSKLASRRAIERSAYQESIDHMRAAHAALQHLPPGAQRDRDELRLLVHLGPLIMATRGIGDREAAELIARMHHLVRRTDQQLTQIGTFSSLAVVWRTRGEIEIADAMAREMLHLAEELGEDLLQLAAHHLLGGNRFHCADLEPARRHFETALEIAGRRNDVVGNMVMELTVASSRCQLAVVLLLGGEADAARKTVETALACHAGSEFSGVRAMLNVLAAWTFVLLRDVDRVTALVEAPAVVDANPPFPLWSSVGQVIRGWALVQRHRVEAGIAEVEAGFAEYVASQGESSTFDYQVLRADAYLCARRPVEAMRVSDEGMETLARYKQAYFAPEMYRIRGELLAADPKAAEACLREGLALARQQKAAAFELRLELSMAPLLVRAGRNVAAWRALRRVLARVEKGGETPDVSAARRLLVTMRA